MKLLKISFNAMWKSWKIPKNKHFIEVWSWRSITTFLNMGWHKKFLYTKMFYTVIYFYFENFKLFEHDLNLIWIFFIFSSKIHGNLKFSQKILKISRHILDIHFHLKTKRTLKTSVINSEEMENTKLGTFKFTSSILFKRGLQLCEPRSVSPWA